MSLRPVILAGGSGTRLWPLSRELYPKQFLPLAGERSMLQESLVRLDGLPEVTSPVVVCNEEHRFLVTEQARELGKPLSSIILEPAGRNTAPALTLAALQLIGQLAGQSDSADAADPVMLVMPADHVIKDVATFQAVVTTGTALAKDGSLVTFGIVPTAPKTGYGYIKKGPGLAVPGVDPTSDDTEVFRVGAFVEKPDGPTAERLWAFEEYLWNSGIFMMRASVWLGQVERYRPDVAGACREAHAGGHWDDRFYRPDPDLFAACPADSIDYAVMEKAAGASKSSSKRRDGPALPAPECVVIPLDADWSDLGAWSEVWEKGDRDEDGNVTQGDVLTESIHNSLLIGRHRLLAAVGLDDLVVVETADAVLVAHKDRVQDVRSLVARLKEQGRPEQANHRKVHRPWGTYETVDGGSRFQVKRLTVNPGAALSLQMHSHRAEHWVVVKGSAKVTRGEESFLLQENESTYVPVGTKHRLENQGPDPLEIIEVQSGSYLEEDDIVRFEDRYNRHDEGDARPRVYNKPHHFAEGGEMTLETLPESKMPVVPPRILLGPGPSAAHPRVLQAMTSPMIGYLDPDFMLIMDEVSALLKRVFQTEESVTLALSGTGSAGMESGLSSLLEPDDTVVMCVYGFFCERMVDMATRVGAKVVPLRADWGRPFPAEMLEAELKKHSNVKMVTAIHAETSTGIQQPLEDLSRLAQEHDALFMVDAVTSLGGNELAVDRWNIDYAYSATQKCLGCPPGLSPVALSPRAHEVVKTRERKPTSWYLDLALNANYWGFDRVYHHTAPVSNIVGLREGLRVVLEEGLDARFARHHRNSEALWAGLEALGLSLVAPADARLAQITPVWIPEGVDDGEVRQILLREYGIEIGRGLGEFGGKVWRIGLMGESSKAEYVLALLSALEEILPRLGFEVPPGGGVGGASRSLAG